MKRFLTMCVLMVPLLVLGTNTLFGQVTTGSVSGAVHDQNGNAIPGASVVALHVPSGTQYGALTRADGGYVVPGMRVGGPYRVTVSHIGYETPVQDNVTVNLGATTHVDFVAREQAVAVQGITVTAQSGAIMSSEHTGASTQISRDALATLPSISGRIQDVARITPQSGGGLSFVGQDSRLNNITIDGSYFNNSFGLGNTPGDRTGVAPVSLASIEQIQINIAPYDVRQGNFVGASINTVTRSGTNDFRGSAYYQFRDSSLVGTKAGASVFHPGVFKYHNVGGWVSGPIMKNKLFFFGNYEDESLTQPGTTWLANTGSQAVTGNVTRVKASDLDALSTFLQTKFDYNPGVYQDYSFGTPAKRGLAKLDYNVNAKNKVSLRYTHLDSNTDVPVSNSSSLGFGTRRSVSTGLNFSDSNYKILENIRSIVSEWNSQISSNKANNFIIGYTYQDESRGQLTKLFPFVDIKEGPSVYTSFGSEPFTPNNELRYSTWQAQDNFSIFGDKSTWTFGVTAEKYHSENVFFPGSQSAYVYNSLADWYTDANDYLANKNRTVSPVTVALFQVRFMNFPGLTKPIQPLDVWYGGVYGQNQYRVNDKLNLTFGLRMDIPKFGNTAYTNTAADAMYFLDETGGIVQYKSGKLPDPRPLWSPRFGFNFDARGDRSTQIRGGTGVFTGPPAYVWISNQIGNTGTLTGFISEANTKNRPFHPDPDHYKPTTPVTGAPPASFELALTDQKFKFPQVWRSDLAVDQRLPLGVIATVEGIYNRDVNGIYYINANLPTAQTAFVGVDHRPRWTSNRINAAVPNNTVMKNQDVGRSWNLAISAEKPFGNGLFMKAGYSKGEAKNTIDPGSIAFGSWNNNQHSGNPNLPGLGFSGNSPGHRLFATASYRAEWFKFGATTVSGFFQASNSGNVSYTFSGDLNGDGGTSNDLIYIPADKNEMNFQVYTQAASGAVPARTFTSQEQADAWEAYILQDPYLSKHRGEYAVRGAAFLPTAKFLDVSVIQDLFTTVAGRKNGLQFRADVLNVGNMINKSWGQGWRFVNTQPLTATSGQQADAQGRAQYRMRNISNGTTFNLMDHTYEKTAGIGDVYRMQFSLRYTLN